MKSSCQNCGRPFTHTIWKGNNKAGRPGRQVDQDHDLCQRCFRAQTAQQAATRLPTPTRHLNLEDPITCSDFLPD